MVVYIYRRVSYSRNCQDLADKAKKSSYYIDLNYCEEVEVDLNLDELNVNPLWEYFTRSKPISFYPVRLYMVANNSIVPYFFIPVQKTEMLRFTEFLGEDYQIYHLSKPYKSNLTRSLDTNQKVGYTGIS
jgi:hypothetical protein